MIVEILAPGVQHGDEADLGTQMSGIGSNPAQCLGDGTKQDRVDLLLVLKGDRGDLLRQGEDEMEIADGQKVCLSGGKPITAGLALAFWAMPIAAGIIGNADGVAVLTLLDMPAQASGPAHLDRTHDATLDTSEMTVVCLTVKFPVAAEYIRYLKPRHHGEVSSARRHNLQRQTVERAGCAADQGVGHLRVARSGGQIVVAQ